MATTVVVSENNIEVIEVAAQGPPGAPGVGTVSTDADNRLTLGTDAGLYVPDNLNPDPLAYYILSKA